MNRASCLISLLCYLRRDQSWSICRLTGGEDQSGSSPNTEGVAAVWGKREGGEDEEDTDTSSWLHSPVTVGGGRKISGIVWRLEDGQPRPRVVHAGRVLALGRRGAARVVCGRVGRAGPAGGLTPHRLEGPEVTGQTRPRTARVVVASLTRV